MCVRVLLAEDTELVRKAIRALLSEREDITLVGDAATLSEVIRKTEELRPDVVIFDLHMANGETERLCAGSKLLAISFANDDEAKAAAARIGAAKLLDKMELANELIPAILGLAPERAAFNQLDGDAQRAQP